MVREIEIEGYRVKYLFDEQSDVAGLVSLIEKTLDAKLKQELLDLLAEIGSLDALVALSKLKYEPKGWKATDVLESLAAVDNWHNTFDPLLDAAIANRQTDPHDQAVSLFAQLRAGRISAHEVVQQFPGGSVRSYRGELDLVKALEGLKTLLSSVERRQLAKLVARVRKDLRKEEAEEDL